VSSNETWWDTEKSPLALWAFLAPLIASPLVAALAGVGVGGAIGGIAGALIPGDFTKRTATRRVKDGGILLSIHCDDRNWTAKPNRSWYATGAQDVAYTGESAADWQKSDKPLPRAS
jgi:hypothetical protein